jgi:hypothetical protein
VIEGDETCDPLGTCVSSCPAVGCQLRTLSGAGTCEATCVDGGQQTVCQTGDGCCPDGCSEANDLECGAVCGNGEIESGETCEGASCPTSCPADGCTTYTLFNAGTCQAQCVATGTINTCGSGDACCPDGCNAVNDGECAPECGNNVIEPGETCEGAGCICAPESLSCFTQRGSPSTCDVVCHVPQQECGVDDGCCPWVQETGGETCNDGVDRDCQGRTWQARRIWDIQWDPCTTFRVPAVAGGDSIAFTTCSPEGGGVGDPIITRIRDDLGNEYPVGVDDCHEPAAIPNLAGWRCTNNDGNIRQDCASANTGGFIVRDGAFVLEITVCGYNNSSGSSPFWILWNGIGNPPG